MNAQIDVSGTVLTTKRLVLRPFCQADLEDFYEYASVDGVGQMAGWNPHESMEESQKILDMFIAEKKTFALEHQGKVIGSLGIEEYDEAHYPDLHDKKCRELGFVLAKPYWGQGLMPEAVGEAVRFLFEDIGLDVIVCTHFEDNERSKRVQEKCGFRYYASGTYTTRNQKTIESVFRKLAREEWLAGRRAR